MASQPRPETESVSPRADAVRWKPATRIAFRFCFVYFSLYCLTTQVLPELFPIPKVQIGIPGTLTPIRQVVFWTAAHVFGVTKPLIYKGSGSGDKTFDWVLAFCALCVAAVATVLWSILDRRRANYAALHKWFHVFLRFAVGSELLVYGMAKIVPLQMPYPSLARLVEPFGNFSPMGVLWYSIGASPGYEIFVGCAEAVGGILLFHPRTATLGALICLADTIEVFMLNMTYDVPVKQFAFHLILMSAFLLAPDIRRILRVVLTDSPVAPRPRPRLFRSARRNRAAVVAQVVYGVALVGLNLYGTWTGWHQYGGGAPKSPLYGIWNVEPGANATGRWRRIIFDRPGAVSFQGPDDAFVNYAADIDMKGGTVTLGKPADKKWKTTLRFERTAPDALALHGQVDQEPLDLRLRLLDRSKLLLVSRGFHWIQEYPFNR